MDRIDLENIKKSTEKAVSESKHLDGDNRSIEVSVNVRSKRIPLPQNIMVFQAFALLAAVNLKPSSNRILMLFFGMSAYENYIGMDVKTISEELNMSERSVIRGLKEIEDCNIIIKYPHPTDRRRHDYFINPLGAWKGNSYARKKALKKLKSNEKQLDLFNKSLPELEK